MATTKHMVVVVHPLSWVSDITLPTVAENAEKLFRKLAMNSRHDERLVARQKQVVVVMLVKNAVSMPTTNADSGNVWPYYCRTEAPRMNCAMVFKLLYT